MSISPQDTMPPGPEDTPFHYPEYSHHGYYPPHAHPGHVQQNSPYFPAAAAAAAMYQPHFHHYHHPHHPEAVAPGDYSPGSEASNEYFYGGSGSGQQSYQQNPGSSFHFDSSDSR